MIAPENWSFFMTLEEIRELIRIASETGVAELEVQHGEHRVRIRRNLDSNSQEVVLPAAALSQTQPVTATPAVAPSPNAQNDSAAEAALDPSLVIVKSPIVGTYYEAPSPGTAPFVQPGDTVHPGQVLCIIESMKLMNEIEAEIAGVVVSRLISNAQPVEYGEALFALRPV
jgi:acetyl-CoA carboxylase biotin carboxyl carrier protein